jgi:hypothetical protein
VDFEKHWPGDDAGSSSDGGIEALQMAYLADARRLPGQPNEFVGFVQIGGQRLLNEDVNIGMHQGPRHGQVLDGGHGDRCSIHLALQVVDGGKRLRSELAGGGGSTCRVGIHNAYQFDVAVLLGKFVIHAGMVASKSAYPDHGDAGFVGS